MAASHTPRWTFTQTTPLGDVSSSYELTPEGIRFRCDAAPEAPELLRWDTITEAGTATLELPYGKGGPDMARWIPGRMEWLLVARSGARAFMRPLPAAGARDAIVAALRERLGPRWVGERIALAAAQKRFNISSGSDTVKVWGLVLSVLAMLVVLLLLVAVLSAVVALPAGFLLGAWCVRRGLSARRDAAQMADTSVATLASASSGAIELEGIAVGDRPVPAGVSGEASRWWDVAVDVWSEDSDGSCWNQVMARHGGSADMFVLDDGTARVSVWLRDADVLLKEHVWESGEHPLPARGIALLESAGFAWNRDRRLRVRETRMAANGPVFVFGTLDEARHLPKDGDEAGLARIARSLRTGSWRPVVVAWMPTVLRPTVTVTLAYLDMLFSVGRGGERARQPHDAPPPVLAPSARVVWKGRAGHALVVSDQRESEAVDHLNRRGRWCVGIGAAILVWCLYELVHLF
jgi:hypothetical protein